MQHDAAFHLGFFTVCQSTSLEVLSMLIVNVATSFCKHTEAVFKMPAVLSKTPSNSEHFPEQERARTLLALLDASCVIKYVSKTCADPEGVMGSH